MTINEKGKTANGVKKILLLASVALFLGGCSLGGSKDPAITDASIFRSDDRGLTFSPKVAIDEKLSLTGTDILSWQFHPTNSDILYIGTLENGLYRSNNKGEVWEKLFFPPVKAYGLAVDPRNGDRLYASGVYADVSKLYTSENAGSEWKEIYTEPGAGSVMIALAIDPSNSAHILAANSNGVVIESVDSGTSWKNVKTFSGPVTQITFVEKVPGTILVLIQGENILVSRDNGFTWPEETKGILPAINRVPSPKPGEEVVTPSNQNTIVVDQYLPGVFYTGTDSGLFRSLDYGVTWEAINILESSKEFPIRAVAVNPQNSREIVYTAGSALYRSKDDGLSWSTTKLDIKRPVQILLFDPMNPDILYFALKKS